MPESSRLAAWADRAATVWANGKNATARVLRRHPALVSVVTALAILAVTPIWRSRFLPLLDEPNHVASTSILRYLGDPSRGLAPYYAWSFRFVPYVVYDALELGLSWVIPLELANKVLQSLYVLSIPAAALVWLRRTGRSPALALLTLPLAYSHTWGYGFQPFNFGLPFLLFAVSALDAMLERPTVARAALVASLAFVCELAHPLIFASLGGAAVGLGLAHARRPLAVLAGAACFAPSLLALKVQIGVSAKIPFASGVATADAKSFDGHWPGVREMLANVSTYALDVVAGDVDVAVFWVLVAASVALLLTGLPERPRLRALGQGLFAYRGALVAAALLALYLALPLHLSRPFDWWFVSGRLAGPFCFFALLLPSGRLEGTRRYLLVPVGVAATVLFLDIGAKYADYGRRMRPLVKLAAHIPAGEPAILLSTHPHTDPTVNVEVYRQIPAWLQVLRGGYSPSGFWNSDHPFKVKRHMPAPPWYSHESFDAEAHGASFAWVMVHGDVPTSLRASPSFRLAAQEGAFSLYARREGASRAP